MAERTMEGKRPSPEDERLFQLAKSLMASSIAIIRPYFLKYLPEPSPPKLSLAPLAHSYMGAQRNEKGENFLTISYDSFKDNLSAFFGTQAERIYVCSHFLHGITHELVHFSQPLHELHADTAHSYKQWVEGTASIISWLIACDLYRNTKSEYWFWLLRRSPENMLRALWTKRLRHGIERVIATYNYIYFLSAEGGNFPYIPPAFMPPAIQQLYKKVVASHGLPFPIACTLQTLEMARNSNLETAYRFMAASRGITASAFLLEKRGMSVKDLVQNPINDAEMEMRFKEATQKNKSSL